MSRIIPPPTTPTTKKPRIHRPKPNNNDTTISPSIIKNKKGSMMIQP
ncbi:hypothetical protein [Mesomycoplasma ovipneumoniae]